MLEFYERRVVLVCRGAAGFADNTGRSRWMRSPSFPVIRMARSGSGNSAVSPAPTVHRGVLESFGRTWRPVSIDALNGWLPVSRILPA